MSLTNPITPLRDAMYALSLEKSVPDAELLNDFVRRFPLHAGALAELTIDMIIDAELEANDVPSGSAEPVISPAVSRAMNRFQNGAFAAKHAETAIAPPVPGRSSPAENLDTGSMMSRTFGIFSRRAFQLELIYFLGAIVSFALAIPAAMYLLVPPRTAKRSGFIDAGDVTQIDAEVPVELSFQESRVDGWRSVTETRTAWVVKRTDGKITAFSPQCPHLGCAYHWEMSQNRFACPCHGSKFAIDGRVLVGPAARSLDQYQTKVENNRLQIGELKESQG